MGPAPDADAPLLDLYTAFAGESEVPPQYHLWCCLAAVAAAVSNRVWLQKGARRVAPNLYTALIGPSAIGKNEAIDTMLDLVRDQPRINVYRGKSTAQAMFERMSKPGPGVPWSHFFLVTPELAWSFGKGELAEDHIKQLTELYGGSVDVLRAETVGRGADKVQAGELCINWISGSTYAWLVKTIPQDSISGGFFGRIVAVPAEPDYTRRYTRPVVHPERDYLLAALRMRLRALSSLTGEFWMSPRATSVEDTWYQGRHAPTDPDLAAAWKRQQDFMLKLAMLFSLCDGDSLVIQSRHVVRAQQVSDLALRQMSQVVNVGNLTTETRWVHVALSIIREYAGPCPHSVLLKRMTKYGCGADGLIKVLQTLFGIKAIAATQVGKGRAYVWQGSLKKYNPDDGDSNVVQLFPEGS